MAKKQNIGKLLNDMRNKKLTKERRAEIASIASKKRWELYREKMAKLSTVSN